MMTNDRIEGDIATMSDHRIGSRASDEEVAGGRRSAALTGAIAAFVLPIGLIATLSVVSGYQGNYIPGVDAPRRDFVRFYTDNFSRIRVTSTMFILLSVLVLVVIVAVVRAAAPHAGLLGIVAITLAGASTAVSVAVQALFVSPTVVLEMTGQNLPRNLDPGVARFLVLAADGAPNAAGVLIGVALILMAVLLVRGDLWGHWVLGITAALMGAVGVVNMVIGGAGNYMVGMIPWLFLSSVT